MISLILGLFALLGFVAFAFYLHNKDKNEKLALQKVKDNVKILEFIYLYNPTEDCYAKAKVIWDGQDFPVELIRDKYEYTYIPIERGIIKRFGSWKSSDDFELYFHIPRYVKDILDEKFDERDCHYNEKRKAEYLSKKRAETSIHE